MSALDNMKKGETAALKRATAFRAVAIRVRSKKTEKAGDLWPIKDPVDGEWWKESTLRRHRNAVSAAYETMADYWAGQAAELSTSISNEVARLAAESDLKSQG